MKAFKSHELYRLSEKCITPFEYLEYSKLDFTQKDLRGFVNALSNIKRAIESQLDIILEIYGLLGESEKNRWPFPYKIDTIQKTGLISPNILKRINKRRNELEHYHKKPSEEEVQDYFDIAELFLEVFKDKRAGLSYYFDYDKPYGFELDREKGEIKIYTTIGDVEEWKTGEHKLNILSEKIDPDIIVSITDLDDWLKMCRKYITPAFQIGKLHHPY